MVVTGKDLLLGSRAVHRKAVKPERLTGARWLCRAPHPGRQAVKCCEWGPQVVQRVYVCICGGDSSTPAALF